MESGGLGGLLKKLVLERIAGNFIYVDGCVFRIDIMDEENKEGNVTYLGMPKKIGDDYALDCKTIMIGEEPIEANRALPMSIRGKYIGMYIALKKK